MEPSGPARDGGDHKFPWWVKVLTWGSHRGCGKEGDLVSRSRETARAPLNLHSAPWSMFPVWQMTSHHHPHGRSGSSNQTQGQILKSEQTIATRWHQTAAGTWPHQNIFYLGCSHFSTTSIKQHAFYMLTCIVHCTSHPKPFRCHTTVFQYLWSSPYQWSMSFANLLGLLQSIENKTAFCL